ncbi:hypothetical protein NSQ20_12190 [Paenibacillus sp. FSL K6-1122]|uniref:hypothetical protein n=1 Tax=Paenibacillus sp. FSL K6-1122 TaxID=2954512 RepID=UPI0030ECC589
MNIFEAFIMMNLGHVVKTSDGTWYKKEGNVLVDSENKGKTWYTTEELIFDSLSEQWELVE